MAKDARAAEIGMGRTLRRILLFVLCLVSLGVFILWRIDNPRVERFRMAVLDPLAPSMEWAAGPMRFARDMVTDFDEFARIYEQNQALREEIQRLKSWRDFAQQLEQENARLRALNSVRLAPARTYLTGEIVADGGGPFLQTGIANVGYRDGVVDGAAVLDGSGLVGRVIGLGRHSARILFVTDYSSRVPVILRPSGKRAILSGDNSGAPRLDFLDTPTALTPGDRVFTSGDGGVFAPDLPVGDAVMDLAGTPRVRLAADFARLDFVRILRPTDETAIDHEGGLIRGRDLPLRPAPGEAPLLGEAN